MIKNNKHMLNKLKQLINNPLSFFIAGFVLGSIFFLLSPAHRDVSNPVGVWGILGYITWAVTALWMLLGGLILKKFFPKK